MYGPAYLPIYIDIWIELGHTQVKCRPCFAPHFFQFSSRILIQEDNKTNVGTSLCVGERSGSIILGDNVLDTWNISEGDSCVNVSLRFNMENSGSGMENT